MTEKQSLFEPKISVIMSVKNGEKTLKKSVESIISQTFTDWEFIICDDGSTDNTLSILKEYQSKDKRIIVLHNETSKGSACGRNACINIARASILALQDADDESLPNRFEVQYEYITQHPEYAIVGTNWFNVDSAGNSTECKVKELPTALDQVNRGLFMHPTFMMRKNDVERVGFYTENKYTIRSQDYHMVMKVLSEGMHLYNLQIPLYKYTVDDGTMNRSLNWNRVKGLMWVKFDSLKRNKLPLWTYIYVLKPVLVNILPRNLMKKHYKKVYGIKSE